MNNVLVDFDKTYQEVDGFGVHGAFHQARNLRLYPKPDQARMLDILFSKQNDGAGFSIIRNIIGDSGVWGNEKDGPIPSIEPEKGQVNLEGDEDQLWFMREAKKRGCDRFVSTVWSPPAWMKTTGDVASGGSLKAACYTDFAEYLARYVKIYKKHHGIDIYAISPSNEPDLKIHYSSCVWSGDQFADFYKDYLTPVFKREGIVAKTFGPEAQIFGNAKLGQYDAFLLDREASAALDILAMHGYPGSVIETIGEKYAQGKKVWMTEACELGNDEYETFNPSIHDGLKVAKVVHDYLTVAGVSAFIYFWGVSMYPRNGGLIGLHLDDMAYTICKRAYTIGNFSRFIRPGSRRVEAVADDLGRLYVSAYKGIENDAVVVAINQGAEGRALSLRFIGAAPSFLTAYVTDETGNLAQEKQDYPVANGRAEVFVKPKSVATYRGALQA
jgi:glucuronoarabinoxylan endo-1,4-beta-xylanase